MKCTILAVAALGLAASASGAFQVCQFTSDKCEGKSTSCFDLSEAKGCQKLDTKLVTAKSYETSNKTDSKITVALFDKDDCKDKADLMALTLDTKTCFKPVPEAGKPAVNFWLNLETAAKKGTGSSVVPSLIASVATVMLGLLF